MKRIQSTILVAIVLFALASASQAQTETNQTKSPWSVRLSGSPLLTNNTSSKFSSEEKTALGFNLGGDLVYTFLQKGKWSFNTSLGLGLTRYNSLRKTDYKNELWTSEYEQVINGQQTFYLTETAKNIEEHQHILFLDIPVKLGADYAITDKWSAYATLGLAYGINLNSTYSSTATLTRTGFYPAYNVLLYDVDVAGSPYFYPTNKAVSGSGSIAKRNNISLEGALGAKYKLSPSVSLFAGAKLMHGFANVKSNPAEFIMATTATSLNTLANRADKLETRAIGLELGVQLALNCERKPRLVQVAGKVMDEQTSAPLSALLLVKSNGETVNTLMADEKGNYSLSLPSGKVYEIEASAAKHTAKTQSLNLLKSTTPVSQDFALAAIPEPVVAPQPKVEEAFVEQPKAPEPAPMAKVVELKFRNIQFKTGTAELTAESKEILDKGYTVISENPKLKIDVVGHTDSDGSAQLNLDLSNRRAKAVADYLIAKGVNASQLKAYGMGQTKPIATNDTPEGKALNRRVEFVVVAQ